MIRVQMHCTPWAPLGQTTGPLAELRDIARNFPRCFTSRSILSSIRRSRAFADTLTTQGLSRWGGTASPEGVRRSIERAKGELDYWDRRLSTESELTYCNDMTKDGKPSFDHMHIFGAINEPYAIAYSIEGARGVAREATRQLIRDLTLGLSDLSQRPRPWYLDVAYLLPIGLVVLGGSAAIGLYRRARGSR